MERGGAQCSNRDDVACVRGRTLQWSASGGFAVWARREHLVAGVNVCVLRTEGLGEAFDEINGAMLTAGATNGDREIAAIGARELGNPVLEEADDVGKHAGDDRMAFQ